jgi:hypothetical protein
MKLPNKSQQKLLDELIRRRFLQVKTDPVLLSASSMRAAPSADDLRAGSWPLPNLIPP